MSTRFFAVLVWLWLGVAVSCAAQTLSGVVVHVADGDSFELRRTGGEAPPRSPRTARQRIRIAAIDAPEATQAHSRAASARLRALLLGRTVVVTPLATDRYGRSVGRVQVAGHDAGLAMLRSGLAWYVPRYADGLPLAERAGYAEAERSARRARVGLWADARPQPPSEWRHSHPRAPHATRTPRTAPARSATKARRRASAPAPLQNESIGRVSDRRPCRPGRQSGCRVALHRWRSGAGHRPFNLAVRPPCRPSTKCSAAIS